MANGTGAERFYRFGILKYRIITILIKFFCHVYKVYLPEKRRCSKIGRDDRATDSQHYAHLPIGLRPFAEKRLCSLCDRRRFVNWRRRRRRRDDVFKRKLHATIQLIVD